ncbi:hypothetical protein [Hydrogenophaga intermedia]|uniref:hypothetical protein n=1 Tax=Hydrogenophaga intermedia TaxID=65786 RepID=UPI002042CE61|nr:hypothetical protein [Hydrogenophaga intermedia]MCM3566022.1 hypothetical protein [Hydrogenophaga intermedia]
MPIKRRWRVRAYSRFNESALPRPRVIMFSDRRRLRRWAAQVLLVWLFGLAMGVANACALGEPAHHRSEVATTPAADAVQKHEHGNEQGDLAKINCLDFCEKSSIGAPQLKVVGDGLAALGFALPVSHTLSAAGQAEHSVDQLVVDSPNLPGGPPPRIAFQRLAL